MSFKNSTSPVNPPLKKSVETNNSVAQKTSQQPAKQTVVPSRPFSPPVDKNKSSSEAKPPLGNPNRVSLSPNELEHRKGLGGSESSSKPPLATKTTNPTNPPNKGSILVDKPRSISATEKEENKQEEDYRRTISEGNQNAVQVTPIPLASKPAIKTPPSSVSKKSGDSFLRLSGDSMNLPAAPAPANIPTSSSNVPHKFAPPRPPRPPRFNVPIKSTSQPPSTSSSASNLTTHSPNLSSSAPNSTNSSPNTSPSISKASISPSPQPGMPLKKSASGSSAAPQRVTSPTPNSPVVSSNPPKEPAKLVTPPTKISTPTERKTQPQPAPQQVTLAASDSASDSGSDIEEEDDKKANFSVDLTIVAAIYGLDPNSKSWTSVDGGFSNVTIFHDSNVSPPVYRIVAQSKNQEYVLNTWLETLQYKKASEQFFHVQIKTIQSVSNFGFQFASAENAQAFSKGVDICLANSKGSNNSVASTPITPTAVKKTIANNNIFSPALIRHNLGRKAIKSGAPQITGQSISSLKAIASSFEEHATSFVKAANNSVTNSTTHLSPQDIWDSVQVVLFISVAAVPEISDLLKNMLTEVASQLNNLPEPTVDEAVIKAAHGLSTKLVLASLAQKISNESNGVRSLSIQMGSLVVRIATWDKAEEEKENSSNFNQLILQLVVQVKSLLECVQRLINDVETLKTIQRSQNPADPISNIQKEEGIDQMNLWEEPENLQPDLSSCSLNQLIYKLTSDINYDNTFLQTFMTTYRSFCSPWTLFEKLKQRYSAPISFDKKKINAIQLRVIIAVKYWLETQIYDFDEDLISQMSEFIDSIGKDGHQDMATNLKRVLINQVTIRDEKTRLLFNLPPPLSIPDNGMSLLELLLSINPLELAQQLTLIDFEIYGRIKPTELLNQSWNKGSLKHRSPNVLAMIHRANRISMWVGCCIMYADRKPQRVKVLEQMIDACSHLVNMNNLNTLMSMVAGLNITPVHRLKKTWKKITNERKKEFEKFHHMLSPDASYKLYRAQLSSTVPPTLPYLGVSLTDLTFLEDGNPDLNSGKLNFKKRELLFKAIRDVLQYQTTPYKFEPKEPLKTLLTELAFLNSDHLYNMSVFIEPKEEKK